MKILGKKDGEVLCKNMEIKSEIKQNMRFRKLIQHRG